MKKFLGVLLVVAGCLVWDRTAQAQETNVPPTRIEAFEVQTGVILLKAVGHVGEISAKGSIISVRYKETTDARTGRKEHGMAIAVKEGDQPEDVTFIDYDEVDGLLDGLNYINTVTFTVTPLPTFEASYMTRGGLHIAAYTSNRRSGTIQAYLQSCHMVKTRLLLTPGQVSQLQSLIQQARNALMALRENK